MPRSVKGSGFRVRGSGPTLWSPASSPQPQSRSSLLDPRSLPSAFTLVEMLVAMAITLVMMGAVVTLFANVSNSVRDRRATMEMSGQLRHARNMLQQDLQGATCPGLTWRRPEENQGYIEIIEGPYREGNASILLGAIPATGVGWPPTVDNPEIDHTTSIIPTSNLPLADPKWVTDGAGLGDYDDILMLTVRNEHEPFVGNMPATVRPKTNSFANTMPNWTTQTIESPLAEVVWYAVENPGFTDITFTDRYNHFFGEPGMRTIYRRTLLIAPWINPYHNPDPNAVNPDAFQIGGSGAVFTAQPGLVRVLPASVDSTRADAALAALIAFQERFDLSVRLEFDPLLDSANGGRWKIVANTLGDLTKRENRYEHHLVRPGPSAASPTVREFPFAVASSGAGYAVANVQLVNDPEIAVPTGAVANAQLKGGVVANYTVSTPGSGYVVRPFAYLAQLNANGSPATTRVMLNDQGQVVQLLTGLAPLSGQRRGEDVMLSDALAFDLRIFDPGAPLYPSIANTSNTDYPGTILEPSDYGWALAAIQNTSLTKSAAGVNEPTPVGAGAYVDLGYWNEYVSRYVALGKPGWNANSMPGALINPGGYGLVASQFSGPPSPKSQLRHLDYNAIASGNYDLTKLSDYDYCTYDTWSFHYEHDGVNQNLKLENALGEQPQPIDRGTNGLDDVGEYLNAAGSQFVKSPPAPTQILLGPDDVGERETAPPYDKPLRGIKVILRVYERDSRQIRQVSVDQHFVPE
jgi:prepilin-type N-terminal cleavage/methylation domain-containing protein